MKIPLSWLREYIDLDEPPRAIADRLTFSGTEVEGIETIGSTYDGFLVAEVRAVDKHPNADKLSVCRVFDGSSELQVVCGAPNVKAGGHYPFAPVGVSLPDGSLTIKKAKIRGVESFGMLCAADELGLSDDHSGLLELDAKWPAGTPLSAVLGPPETVLELEITPNRPDCLSLIGIARELAALYQRPLKMPLPKETENGKRKTESDIVRVEDAAACARYTARLLENVAIGPSPDWMKRRLEAAGIRSINNVVDITNYVMLETGHPLHAFDRDLLAEGRVIVRRARAGERMRTLDDIERELDPSMLIIADAGHPVAVAGVMGGAGSEIRPETRNVLLESAWFDPTLVRATARKLGLSTESSYRFERGVDIETVEWASRRAAQLMVELAGARIVGDLIDTRPDPAPARRVSGRFQTVRDVLGIEISDAEIAAILQRLEIPLSVKNADGAFEALIPSFRSDLEREIDLVEEVARVYGLDKIPAPHPRATVDPTAGRDPSVRAKAKLRGALAGLGLSEILNYSLVSDPLLDLFDSEDRARRVAIPRPITADQSVLRPSLIPQMTDTLGRNRAHQIDAAALYEIGRVFARAENGEVREEERLCLGLMGPVGRTGLDRRRAVTGEEMFLWAKGLVESLVRAMNLDEACVKPIRLPWAESGSAVEISAGDTRLGVLGLVDRRIRKEWRLSDPVAIAELSLAPLLARATAVNSFRDIPAYPSVARDVAMIVTDNVSHADIVRVIRAAAPPELEAIELFDVFTGPSIGAGRRSVAYSLTYRSAQRTLTDDEANVFHDKIKSALRADLKAEIREG